MFFAYSGDGQRADAAEARQHAAEQRHERPDDQRRHDRADAERVDKQAEREKEVAQGNFLAFWPRGAGDMDILLPEKFEDIEINIPNDYDYVLSTVFGKDYMKLPPIEKRITHAPLKIEV